MRRRRAERCLERADQALSAGSLDKARAATEEARELDASLAGIAEMEQRLRQPAPPPELMLRPPTEVVTSAPLPVEVTLKSPPADVRPPRPPRPPAPAVEPRARPREVALKPSSAPRSPAGAPAPGWLSARARTEEITSRLKAKDVRATAVPAPGLALPTVVDVQGARETPVQQRRRPFYYSAAALACACLAVLIAVLFGWRGTPASQVPPPVQADLRGDVTLPPATGSPLEADTPAVLEAPAASEPARTLTAPEPDPADSAAVPTSGRPSAFAPATSSAAARPEVELAGPAADGASASPRDAGPPDPATRNVGPPVPAPREDVPSAPAPRDEAPQVPQGAPVASLSDTLAGAAPLAATARPSPPPSPAADAGVSRSRSREAEAAPRVDPQAAVRATLGRYEAAYNGLDVSAARAVWPGVNQQALARAFDGLASQRVALDNCDVLVNGATARATCSGRAEWTPKVGGGQHRQNRRWAFELANAGGTWQIVRAETR